MAQKGVLKRPRITLDQACDRAVEIIDFADGPVAIFMVAGKLRQSRKSSPAFERTVKLLNSNFVGVYDMGFDFRRLREDLGEFYKGAA